MKKYFFVLFLFALSSFAAAQDHEIAPVIVYVNSHDGLRYDNGNEPCRIIANNLNAAPYPSYSITHNNPRYGTHPTLGVGCYYDETHRVTGVVTYNVFRQNYVWLTTTCPTGYSRFTSPYGRCFRSLYVEANKTCLLCNDQFGNPIATGSGAKIEYTSDAITSSLNLKRTFRSINPIASVNLLNLVGKGWHSDLTRRIIIMPANTTLPASAMVMRNDGTTMIFTKNTSGAWVPEADLVRYRLEEVVVGGQTHYVVTSPSNHQEIYNAAGYVYQDLQDGRLLASYQRDSTERLTSFQDANGRTSTLTYLTSGLIDKIDLPDGQIIDYGYDSSARLTTVTKGSDVTTYSYTTIAGGTGTYLSGVSHNGVTYSTFTYNAGYRANSTEHAGGVDRFSVVYSNSDNTATVTTPTGATKVLKFSLVRGSRIPGSIQQLGAGVTTVTNTLAYDAFSNIVSDKGSTLLSCHYYDTTGRYKTATYEFAVAVVATCPSTQSAAASSTFLRATTTQWDAVLNVATERKVLNASSVLEARTTYAYNTRSQVTAACQIDPGNSTAMSYVCGASTNAPVGVRQSTTTYCELADVTAGTCPLVGLAISSNGPRTDVSDISTFTYYQNDHVNCVASPTTCAYRKGDLWKVTNALSQTSEYVAYDGGGRALQMKDANNVITDMEYNARGWLTARKVRGTNNASESDDVITRMDYDLTGQVTKVTQPDGDYVNFNYDAAHRLTSISDALNNSITYTLNNNGDRTAEVTKDPSATLTRNLSRVYDSLGRLQLSKNAANTAVATLTYDTNDNLNTNTDGLSRVTDQDVDPLNRLIKTIQDQGAGKINATTQFEYDARDNLTKVIDPKTLNTVYSYNGLNELSQLVSPDTGTTTYTYDSSGNRASQTDARSVVTNYSYDVLNRLTQVSYPSASGLNSSFIYDTVNGVCGGTENFAKGRLTQFTDASGDTQYCYDRFGNLTRKQITNNGNVATLLFEYTKAGRISSITYPSGMLVSYAYNNIGQTTQVIVTQGGTTTTLVDNITYLPFGPLKQLRFPVPAGGSATSALTQTRTYDNDYAIQSIGGLNYVINVQGNITSIIDGSGGNTFEYDNLDRLKKVKDSTTTADVTAFTYDATGNRLSKKVGAAAAVTNTYPGTNHRLTQVGATVRTLDASGNTTQSASNQYFTYDARNRMVDFRTGVASNTIVSQYQYNAKGERVRKYNGGTDQARYIYIEGGQLLLQDRIVGGVTTTQEMIWLGDMPVGVSQNGVLHGVLADHLNTPRQVFELGSQTKVWAWSSVDDAFGENLVLEDVDANSTLFKLDMRFPGQLYDVESGLHYNYFRIYGPDTGRFNEADPIGFDGGISLYAYVSSSPLMFSDALGLLDPNPSKPVLPPRVPIGPTITPIARPPLAPGAGVGLASRLGLYGLSFGAGYAIGNGVNSYIETPLADAIDDVCNNDDHCYEEIADCERKCRRARTDPDMRNIWGGSWARCMLGCVSWGCMDKL